MGRETIRGLCQMLLAISLSGHLQCVPKKVRGGRGIPPPRKIDVWNKQCVMVVHWVCSDGVAMAQSELLVH